MYKTTFIALFILVLTACSSTQVTSATLPTSLPASAPTLTTPSSIPNTPTATATYTPTATATDTSTPEPEFSVCPIENYKDCPLTIEQASSPYFDWLYTLPPTKFDPSKVKERTMGDYSNGLVMYNTKDAPHFTGKNAGTEDFNRDRTFAYLSYEGHDYIVMPIEYYDENNPNQNQWVITLCDVTGLSDVQIQVQIKIWQDDMNVTQWVDSNSIQLINGPPDPVVTLSMANNPDWKDRIVRFVGGTLGHLIPDRTALSKRGIFLLGLIGQDSGGEFQ